LGIEDDHLRLPVEKEKDLQLHLELADHGKRIAAELRAIIGTIGEPERDLHLEAGHGTAIAVATGCASRHLPVDVVRRVRAGRVRQRGDRHQGNGEDEDTQGFHWISFLCEFISENRSHQIMNSSLEWIFCINTVNLDFFA